MTVLKIMNKIPVFSNKNEALKWGEAYELTKPTGRTILVGVPSEGSKAKIFTLPLHFDKVLTGSHGGESNPSIDIPNYFDLYNAGKLELKQLITNHYSLENINDAINDMCLGKNSGRCIITM